MMDKLLFRAWEKKNKHFVYFEIFPGVNNYTPLIYATADIEPWEQYVGKKDVNGKDVFVGDILEGNYETEFGSYSPLQKKVIYCKGACGFEGAYLTGDGYPHHAIGENIKVIGNIHENEK